MTTGLTGWALKDSKKRRGFSHVSLYGCPHLGRIDVHNSSMDTDPYILHIQDTEPT